MNSNKEILNIAKRKMEGSRKYDPVVMGMAMKMFKRK
jgi:hypothetical protein